MPFQLHIWSPAFSLPSIDPHCLAALVYLKLAVPAAEWKLVASCDPTLSPTKELPALRDASVWIGGFRNIVDYLDKKSGGLWSLDRDDPKQTADNTAFESFIGAHVQPLLDLSLYLSSENYTTTTRPTLSSFLQWPNSWLIPPKHRAAAKARTEYLGLSSLDLDNAYDTDKESKANPYLEQIPQSMRISRQSVSSLVKQPHQASKIRLEAHTDNAMGPLQELLGTKQYMLSEDRPSSLDCLAWAYLALALCPELPQPWLAESMRARYPSLCTYVNELNHEAFHELSNTRENHGLPWEELEQTGWNVTRNLLFDEALGTLPMARRSYVVTKPLSKNASHESSRPESLMSRSNAFMPAVAIATTIAALGAYVIQSRLLGAATPGKRSLSDYGDVGAMLAMVDFGDHEQSVDSSHNDHVGLVEVDVPVDENNLR